MLVIPMIANAGVFLVFAGGAIADVQVELLDRRLGVGVCLDLHDDGMVVAGGNGFVGKKRVAVPGEGESEWRGPVSSGQTYDLIASCDRFQIVVQEVDSDATIAEDDQLGVGFDAVNQATAPGTACPFSVFSMIVAVMILSVFTFGVFATRLMLVSLMIFSVMVLPVGVMSLMIMSGVFVICPASGKSKGKRREHASKLFCDILHFLVFHFVQWVEFQGLNEIVLHDVNHSRRTRPSQIVRRLGGKTHRKSPE